MKTTETFLSITLNLGIYFHRHETPLWLGSCSFWKSTSLQHEVFGLGPPHFKHTFREHRVVGRSGFMSVSQLFKPQLFTDNLLSIQLFILRQRPAPSQAHKNQTSADCERLTPTLSHQGKYIYSPFQVLLSSRGELIIQTPSLLQSPHQWRNCIGQNLNNKKNDLLL